MAKRRQQGSGSIFQRDITRNGKVYHYWAAEISAGVDMAGNLIKKQQKLFKTQREAVSWLNATQTQIQSGDFLKESSMSLSQWLDTFMSVHCPHLKYLTRKSYITQIENHIKPALGKKRLDKLTATDIQQFINQLGIDGQERKRNIDGNIVIERVPLSAKSIKNAFEILNVALEKAVDLDLMKRNPCGKATLPKIQKPEIKPLNEEQISAFLSEITDDAYGDALRFILFSGCRESECLGLRWCDINFRKGTASINGQLVKHRVEDGGYQHESTKNGKSRTLTLAPSVLAILKSRQQKQLSEKKKAAEIWTGWQTLEEYKTAYCFTDECGKNLTPKSLYKRCKKICEKIGCPEMTVHGLRHSYATIALQGGDSLKTVSENLGHSTIAITADIYASVSDTMKRDSANRMEAFIKSVAVS